MKINIISRLRKYKYLIIILIIVILFFSALANYDKGRKSYFNVTEETLKCEDLPLEEIRVGGPEYPKYECFSVLSIKANNVILCNNLGEETFKKYNLVGGYRNYSFKQACYNKFYRNLIKTLKNSSACEDVSFNFSHEVSLVDCYYILALETKDSTYCDESLYNDSCYFDVALETGESSTCDKINSTYEIEFRAYPFSFIRWKDYCYIKVNACERIENITLREYCLGWGE